MLGALKRCSLSLCPNVSCFTKCKPSPGVLLRAVKTARSTCKHNNWELGHSARNDCLCCELAATVVRQMLPLPWR